MTGPVMQALTKFERELGPFDPTLIAADPASPWRHWHLRTDERRVAWLLLDHADSSTNVLSRGVVEELDKILDQLIAENPRGLVIRSAKESNFCVGADIKEFRHLNTAEEAEIFLSAAHEVANRLAGVRFPTVAVVHGQCLGGGLELALCCDYRLAVPGAKFGFPEVLLGLHPGLGGSVRTTQLMDPIAAMTMMLTGKNMHDRKAKKTGLVDVLVPERHIAAAVDSALNGGIERHKPGLKARLLNTRLARQQVAKKMREQAAAQAAPAFYPAPNALIKLWEEHGDNPKAMFDAEIRSFAQLLTTDTAQNLVRVFFLREKMKSLAPKGLGSNFKRVHVIGAGTMGGDIAAWFAVEGLTVTLFDTRAESIAGAVKRAARLCDRKHLSEGQKREVLDRLIHDLNNDGVRSADVVIEAVSEDIALKQKIYQELEPQLKPGAILATNTSSIPLKNLQEHLQQPERLVGLHFFNPVAQMQLIEVISHSAIAPETFDKALAFSTRISRLPAPLASAPGFLVNRALTPYLMEAMVMLDEGVAAESIDRAAESFGMPMGPIELADQVGLDICLGVADMLRERLGGDLPATPEWLQKKVNNGQLGKKTGQGLYTWKDGEAQKQDEPALAPEDTVDRLILPMLNACMACLREGVINDEDLLDGAMIFGTGFAPFRGGPMHYARKRGFSTIASKLHLLAETHGARFTPDAGWIHTQLEEHQDGAV